MKITLKGNPLSTNHIYRHNRYGVYMTPKGKALKESYQWDAKTQFKGDPIYGPVELDIKLYFGDKRKRDIDNYNKILLDSMSGIVFDDDKQIQKIIIEKGFDKKKPRTEIEINKYGKK